MNLRTKALAINKAVKDVVFERDNKRCILCGSPYGLPEAHYIQRSKGGLGIEQNIVTLCRECHRRFDQTTERAEISTRVKAHLDLWYPEFDDEKRVFKK